jgi:drug/metabolite transporter (DMT)-like permease
MAVVAPLSAVGAAVLPVAVGFLTGERPATLTWVGIIAAFPAIWLVSTIPETGPSGARSRSLDAGVVDGLLAGFGFGLLFSALGQVPDGAGLGPLAAAQSTSVLAIAVVATSMREPWVPRERSVLPALIVGVLVAAAALLFLLATQSGLLTVASVVTSLYPAFTVLLAATLLKERVHRAQAVGMVLALTAVALIAAG